MTRRPRITASVPRRRAQRPLLFESLESRHLLSFTARQVFDLNTDEVGTRSGDFLTVGDELYFVAPGKEYGFTHSLQLWKYDGNAVSQLTQIPSAGVTTPPVELDGDVYFGGDIGDESAELWRYSRERGAEIAVDLNPNDNNYEDGSYPHNLTVFDGRLYFSAYTVDRGTELWSFDGAAASLAANINQVPVSVPGYEGADGSSFPRQLTVHGDSLYFVAGDGVGGPAIWRFDGRSAAVALDIDPDDVIVGLGLSELTSFQGDLYFIKHAHEAPAELWRYHEGAASQVGRFASSAFTSGSAEYQGHLYFTIPTTVHDWRRLNHEVWRTDGVQLERMAGFPTVASLDLAIFRDELYFIANDGLTGDELWKYDGGRDIRATDINISGDSVYTGFAVYGDELHFAATDTNLANIEIWEYDGDRVRRAVDVRPGTANAYPGPMTTLDGALYFFATPGDASSSSLFRLDGESATSVALGINSAGGWGPFFAHTSGGAYFIANSSASGNGLWRLAGGNATLVSHNCGGNCLYIHFEGIIAFGDEVFFAAVNSDQKRSIWKFDGHDFTEFPDVPIDNVDNAKVLRNQLYMSDIDRPGTLPIVLRYDGSDFDDVTDSFGAYPFLPSAVDFDGRIYYPASSRPLGSELWSTDLTPGGARLAAEPPPGNNSSSPGNLTLFGGQLYFTASDPRANVNIRRLYRLVGAQAIPVTEGDLSLNVFNFAPPISVLDNQLIFPAATANSQGLWSYDGRHASPVADFSNAPFSFFGAPTRLNDTIYFSADDAFHGSELWQLTIDRDADLDGDGVVGMADAVILQRNLGVESAATHAQGDLDGDGAVTTLDASILAKQFGRRTTIVAPSMATATSTAARAPSTRRLAATRGKIPPQPQAVDAALTTTLVSSRRPARSLRHD